LDACNFVYQANKIFGNFLTSAKRSYGITIHNFDLLSSNSTFTEDFQQLEHKLGQILNDASSEQKNSCLNEFRKLMKNFYEELVTLEIIVLLAAFIDQDGKFIVNLFKSWNISTNRFESHNYVKFMSMIFSNYYMGYYYKLVYLMIICKSEIEFYNLHQEMQNESNQSPPLELFRQKSSSDLLAVSILF
jgi:hypothetical protein